MVLTGAGIDGYRHVRGRMACQRLRFFNRSAMVEYEIDIRHPASMKIYLAFGSDFRDSCLLQEPIQRPGRMTGDIEQRVEGCRKGTVQSKISCQKWSSDRAILPFRWPVSRLQRGD